MATAKQAEECLGEGGCKENGSDGDVRRRRLCATFPLFHRCAYVRLRRVETSFG